ncbi:hypothetical protein O181_120998, partial [Austropuccinia psidii MF-1]|nr:hypothetical protein [Austropuccinia psidii MF-1]
VGKIENAKDEWRNRGANLSSVGCILVNYEGNIPANQGACKFASTLTFTMNGFKNSPHLDKDASLYASGWWFQANKGTDQIQRDASKRCTGGKLIFPNEHLWIDLSDCHGLIQVLWASSIFVHYIDPAQDNKSTTLVGMVIQSHANSKNEEIHMCVGGEVDYVWWHAIVNMSWFVALVQDSDASHANPYAYAGSDNAKSSLCLCGLPTLHMPILTPVQVPETSHANPYACAGSRQFTHQTLCL